ncbi:MAG: hypothetical protein ACREJM_00765 [Candidatus Saccharimonadales bacterium]
MVDNTGLLPPGWRYPPAHQLYQLQLPPSFMASVNVAAQIGVTRGKIAAKQAEYDAAQQDVMNLEFQQIRLGFLAALAGGAERHRAEVAARGVVVIRTDNLLRANIVARDRLQAAYQRRQTAADQIELYNQQLEEQQEDLDALTKEMEYLLNMPGHQHHNHP